MRSFGMRHHSRQAMNSPGSVYRSSSTCGNVALGGSFIVSTFTRAASSSRWSRWQSSALSATK